MQLRRLDPLAGEEHALGLPHADEPLGMTDPAEHADGDLLQREPGAVGGDDEVTRRDQRHSGPDGGTVDRGDDGHGAVVDAPEAPAHHSARVDLVSGITLRAAVLAPPVRPVATGRVLQVDPAAERALARGRQHGHTHRPVVGERLERRRQRGERRPVEGVHRRPVEGDDGDPAGLLDTDGHQT